jgi:hypothetical protein
MLNVIMITVMAPKHTIFLVQIIVQNWSERRRRSLKHCQINARFENVLETTGFCTSP